VRPGWSPKEFNVVKRLSLIAVLVAVPAIFNVTATSLARAADGDAKALKEAKTKSPAKNDIDFVEFKMNSVTKQMAKPTWRDEQSTLMTLYNHMVEFDKRLGTLKSKDPKWDTKAYEAWYAKTATELQKAIDALNAKQQAAERVVAQHALFSSMRHDYAGPISDAIDVVNEHAPAQLSDITSTIESISRLADVEKQCKTNAYLEIQPYFENKDPAEQPEVLCGLAAERKKLLKQLVPLAAKANLALLLEQDKKAIDDLKNNGVLSPYVTERLGNVAAYSKKSYEAFATATAKAGAKVDAAYFKPVEKNGPVFAAALTDAAKKDRFPSYATVTDQTLQAKVQPVAGALGGSLVRFRMSSGGASVIKNDIGIPLHKSRSGALNVKVGSESYCRVYPGLQFVEVYTGAGTYAKAEYSSGVSSNGDYLVSVCK
jgi:hypothetical protein